MGFICLYWPLCLYLGLYLNEGQLAFIGLYIKAPLFAFMPLYGLYLWIRVTSRLGSFLSLGFLRRIVRQKLVSLVCDRRNGVKHSVKYFLPKIFPPIWTWIHLCWKEFGARFRELQTPLSRNWNNTSSISFWPRLQTERKQNFQTLKTVLFWWSYALQERHIGEIWERRSDGVNVVMGIAAAGKTDLFTHLSIVDVWNSWKVTPIFLMAFCDVALQCWATSLRFHPQLFAVSATFCSNLQ